MELSSKLAQSIIASQAELIRRLQTELAELQVDHEIVRVNYQNLQETHVNESEVWRMCVRDLDSELTDSKFACSLANDKYITLELKLKTRDVRIVELESTLADVQRELAMKDKRLESDKKNLTKLEQCLAARNAAIDQLYVKLQACTKSS